MENSGDKYIPKMTAPSSYTELNATFGIDGALIEQEPQPPRVYPVVDSSEHPVTQKERDDDFATVRATLHRILQKAENNLDDLSIVAKGSEHPRSYEVVSTLINTITDITVKIVEVHEKKAKLDLGKTESPIGNIEQQNNIVFTGSTAELLDSLKRSKEKVIDNGDN
jgi:hypothetical protein